MANIREATYEELQARLDNVNDMFRRKTAAVTNNYEALELISKLYCDKVIDIEKFDIFSEYNIYSIPLALLTAANLVEIGAKIVYITESGFRYVDSLIDSDITSSRMPETVKEWHQSDWKKNCESIRKINSEIENNKQS